MFQPSSLVLARLRWQFTAAELPQAAVAFGPLLALLLFQVDWLVSRQLVTSSAGRPDACGS